MMTFGDTFVSVSLPPCNVARCKFITMSDGTISGFVVEATPIAFVSAWGDLAPGPSAPKRRTAPR